MYPKLGCHVNGFKSCPFLSKQQMLSSKELESNLTLYKVLNKELFKNAVVLKVSQFPLKWLDFTFTDLF